MRKFGTKVHILDKNLHKDKFDPRVTEGIFVGYPKTSKGFRVWIPKERKFVIARDIQFHEEEPELKEERICDCKNKVDAEKNFVDVENINKNVEMLQLSEITVARNIEDKVKEQNVEINDSMDEDTIANIQNPTTSTFTLKRGSGRPRVVRSSRVGHPKKIYEVVEPSEDSTDSEASDYIQISLDMDNQNKSVNQGLSENLNEDLTDFVGTVQISLKDALNGDESFQQKEAILSEIRSLVQKDTWDIVKRPWNRNVIGCRYILNKKKMKTGHIGS